VIPLALSEEFRACVSAEPGVASARTIHERRTAVVAALRNRLHVGVCRFDGKRLWTFSGEMDEKEHVITQVKVDTAEWGSGVPNVVQLCIARQSLQISKDASNARMRLFVRATGGMFDDVCWTSRFLVLSRPPVGVSVGDGAKAESQTRTLAVQQFVDFSLRPDGVDDLTSLLRGCDVRWRLTHDANAGCHTHPLYVPWWSTTTVPVVDHHSTV
jgi:hypothetical protein